MTKRMVKYLSHLVLCSLVLFSMSCGKHTEQKRNVPDTLALASCPAFRSDSAFLHIQKQCDFGPRVTGTEEARACGDYIAETFRRYGAQVTEQKASVTLYDGSQREARNIIAVLNPEQKERVLLCAHWDTRPWADNDPDPKNHKTPIAGANDGASGVAVLLELCRLMQLQPVALGVDLVCFDAEDMGTPQWADSGEDDSDTWCLGSKVWAERAVESDYRARYGVLLDMVGGRGVTFSRELISRHFADPVVDLIWSLAGQLGYRHYFPMRDGGYLTDDHVNVNRITGIPCVDIVPYFDQGPSVFGPTWHTLNDTPDNIDPRVLEAVGHTLTQLLYNENVQLN